MKPIQANVRIITATHKALREEAKAGRFRHDLLYRLRVIPILYHHSESGKSIFLSLSIRF